MMILLIAAVFAAGVLYDKLRIRLTQRYTDKFYDYLKNKFNLKESYE